VFVLKFKEEGESHGNPMEGRVKRGMRGGRDERWEE
jgi:hypothetical protein